MRADFVPPPESEVPSLVADVAAFLTATHGNPVVRAAIAYRDPEPHPDEWAIGFAQAAEQAAQTGVLLAQAATALDEQLLVSMVQDVKRDPRMRPHLDASTSNACR